MTKDSIKNGKVKHFSKDSLQLPNFSSSNYIENKVLTIEGTNVIRVPFGVRISKKQRPEKSQNIATLVLPITSFNSPTPPPNVA